MRKGGLVPVRECEWDMRSRFTKSGPGDSQSRFPRTLCRSCRYGHIPGFAAPARGKRRWKGATPPFSCPVRARGCCAIHICAAPPGGVAPFQNIPGGKDNNRPPVTGKMGGRSIPDLHTERLKTLRRRAVEMLRARRACRCPDCGDRSSRRDGSRCGDPGETAARPPSSQPCGPGRFGIPAS